MVGFRKNFFKQECQTCGVNLTLAAPEHQKMNRQVEVTWRTLRTISHSLMVHARVSEEYMHFSFMYTTDHIFPVLPIKDMINKDSDLTTPYKLATGTNLQYHIYVCCFVHVLYEKILHTSGQRR